MTDYLTRAWAESVLESLLGDPRFEAEAKWFRGAVEFADTGRSAVFEFSDTAAVVVPPGSAIEARFGISGPEDAWSELFESDTGNLNKSVRQGRLLRVGDTVDLMKFWKLVFLLADAGRRLALGRGGR